MGRPLLMLFIGLFFGAGLGVVFAAGQGLTLDGHDHSDPAHHGSGMGHEAHAAMHAETVEVPGTSLEVEATPDPVGGYNLHLVTGLTFSPENASGDHVPGEGHAHVFVDGVKIGRFYSPWVHVAEGGEVRVTLNANDHRALAVDGAPVEVMLNLQ